MEMFPDGYWDIWQKQYNHSFFDLHWNRTINYFAAFINDFWKLSVLETGGYPGLLLAIYKAAGAAEITSIDSPRYRPEHYLEWCKSQGIRSIEHDIVQGSPNMLGHWDVGVVSDVLLHIDGVPEDYLIWLGKSCDRVLISNPPKNPLDRLGPAHNHSLDALFHVADQAQLTDIMAKAGMKFHQSLIIKSDSEDRLCLDFRS